MTRPVRANWQDAVLICKKCSKKAKGGFGPKGKWRLAKALKDHLGKPKKGRKAPVGIVEVKCLSVCPKRGITVVSASDLLNWRIVEPGTPVETVIADLGLGATGQQ